MRKLALFIYTALGWKINGTFPSEVKKMVVIAAPHTSWHDFYLGLLFRRVINVQINFLGKKELFKWPFGWYFRKVGGIPLDRFKSENKVDRIARMFEDHDTFRLALSPEGTRKKVDHWKTGFYYIALKAQVPILPITMDFGKKEHRIGRPFYPTGDCERDLRQLQLFFKNVEGKFPERS